MQFKASQILSRPDTFNHDSPSSTFKINLGSFEKGSGDSQQNSKLLTTDDIDATSSW